MKTRKMRIKKSKTVYCYLDGKKHCDVVQWALAANMLLTEAKEHLTKYYSGLHEVTFKIQ